MKLEEIRLDNSNGCTICILGGDQIRMWAQELTVYQCSIPMAHAKDLFADTGRFISPVIFHKESDPLMFTSPKMQKTQNYRIKKRFCQRKIRQNDVY